jgi:hypothetical protein
MLRLETCQRWRMAFNPRRLFSSEVAGIATIAFSVAAHAIVGFSVR